ncbi:hypothetical protein B5M42_021025 [Paenibacillus athensensis]|uniref:Uncharacterized protein n=1 Tax=Paenibacillus athensensis TaxID=1967502 RepID=A0A4Y8PYN7_9BACL|nr:hypothetical protein [Paenibacillus athensensis]MCD1261288.1 hypothetical protein [Paenibacillus athensensis]
MGNRILHCGASLENYYTCVNQQVAGFTKRVASVNDLVYIVVKIGGKSLCGARGRLKEPTDFRPWKDSDQYPQCFSLGDIEYCQPFDISILEQTGGKYWSLKYVQSAKNITDEQALHLLQSSFEQNRIHALFQFEQPSIVSSNDITSEAEEPPKDEITEENYQDVLQAVPDVKINITSTYVTVKFENETDKIKGLEPLVNSNFYNLFDDFIEERSVLIPQNKMFMTSPKRDAKNKMLAGISGCPDAVLVRFVPDHKTTPIQINLIEYECYGRSKKTRLEKFEYLNGHIIPQLMRFASTFSIAADTKIREDTVHNWISKIIKYINEDDTTMSKAAAWMRELDAEIKEQNISYRLHSLLNESFRSNLRIVLVIDELTTEQNETIKNIIGSFKLENEKSIDFLSFVVKLQQKIDLLNNTEEYALSLQK